MQNLSQGSRCHAWDTNPSCRTYNSRTPSPDQPVRWVNILKLYLHYKKVCSLLYFTEKNMSVYPFSNLYLIRGSLTIGLVSYISPTFPAHHCSLVFEFVGHKSEPHNLLGFPFDPRVIQNRRILILQHGLLVVMQFSYWQMEMSLIIQMIYDADKYFSSVSVIILWDL
jgi:hypothetical protein